MYQFTFDKFIFNFTKFKNINNKENNEIILVQIIEDFEYALRMGAASKYLSEKYLLDVKLFDCYWNVRLNKYNFQKYFNYYNIIIINILIN